MGSSKKANRKQPEISLIKIKALDTVFETTEDVPKQKSKMAVHDRESALEITGTHAKLCEMKKKRKCGRLEKTEGKSFSTPIKVTETILNITSKLNPEFKVHGDLGVALQTRDNTVEGNAVSKRIKSKKKRHNEVENTDRNENFMEVMKHVDKNLSFSEISDINLSTNKKSNGSPTHGNLITVEPSTSSECDTNSMRKSDLISETNMVSAGKDSLITYRRKKNNLSHRKVKQLLLSKEEPPNSSLQDERNSSKEEVTLTYSNDVLRHMDTKGKAKSEIVNCEGNLDVAEKVKRQMGSFAEKNLEAFSSNNKLHKVKEDSISCNVIQNNATGGVYADSSDNELAPGKIREKKVTKLMQSNSEDGISNYISKSDGCDEHLADEHLSELSKVQVILEEGGISVEASIEESKNGRKKDKSLVSVETGDIKHGEHKNEEKIPLSSSNSDIKEGCSPLLPAVQDVSLGKNSANNLVPKSSRRARRKKRKDVKHTANEDKASVCDPPAKQPESVPAMEEYPPLGEKNLEVEAVHVSVVEDLDISRKTCQMEVRTLANGDVTKDGVVNEEGNHLNVSSAVSVTAPISCTRRKLLVLDLNGILVDIVSDVPKGYKADTRIARKALFKRPFCDDFLKFCFENFHVGVWSSRMKRNVNGVVDFLMAETRKNLLFCWDQSHCTETGVGTIENRQKPLVLKELKKLWSKHEQSLPWEKGMYDESNTLLLDDSPYKALRNPPHTAIFPRSYTFQDTDDNSLGPGGDLRVYLEGLATAENVQEYVKQHPFGQRAITNNNPSWAFYLRIIGVNNVPTLAGINSPTAHLQMG